MFKLHGADCKHARRDAPAPDSPRINTFDEIRRNLPTHIRVHFYHHSGMLHLIKNVKFCFNADGGSGLVRLVVNKKRQYFVSFVSSLYSLFYEYPSH